MRNILIVAAVLTGLGVLLARMADSPMRVEVIDPGSPSYRFLVSG